MRITVVEVFTPPNTYSCPQDDIKMWLDQLPADATIGFFSSELKATYYKEI